MTDHERGVGGFRWAPDGRTLAYAARPPETEEETAEEEAGCAHLWVLGSDAEARPLFDGALHVSSFAWTPDGKTLVFAAATSTTPDHDLIYRDLYRVPAAGGAPELLFDAPGKLGDFAVSPDGRHVAGVADAADALGGLGGAGAGHDLDGDAAAAAAAAALDGSDPLPQTVHLVPLRRGEVQPLAAGREASAFALSWTKDGRLLVVEGRGTGTALVALDRSGTLTELATSPILSSVAAAGGQVVAVGHTPGHPDEVFRLDGTVQRLTRHNSHLDDLRLAPRQTITWTGPADWTIEGVLTRPAGRGPHPLVVQPHGGPEGTSRAGWDRFAQLLAARGYLVLQPNYRGSGGRGVAFSKGDHNDLGGAELDDLVAGVDHLVASGEADPDRVGIGGWSYGGYLSAMAATHRSDRFRAAIMGAGISNWVSFAGTNDIPDEMNRVHWNESWHDRPAHHWQRSALSGLSPDSAPTLVVHGADDPRVPAGQAWELYRGLRHHGVEAELVLYPRSGHRIEERAHWLDLMERELGWFDHHLADPATD